MEAEMCANRTRNIQTYAFLLRFEGVFVKISTVARLHVLMAANMKPTVF
jgi:hypothetical protein